MVRWREVFGGLKAILLLGLVGAGGAWAQTGGGELDRRAAWDNAAATELGLRLEMGIGVAADPIRAAQLICRAATAGYGPAAQHLAASHLQPDMPGYDPAQAAAWLRFMQTRELLGPRARVRAPGCEGAPRDASGRSPFAALAEQLAFERGLPANLVKAIIAAESSWQADAVSPAGAQGLMQLMPGTARRRGVTDPLDPEQNLRGGMDHLAGLLRRYGDPVLALAAYNAGEGPVDACRCVPNIPETVEYVIRVRALGGLDPAISPVAPERSRSGPASRATSGGKGPGPGPRG